MSYSLYSEITFNQDLRHESILKGDIGTIVDYHEANHLINEPGYTIEIFDAYGNTLKVVTVPESKISLIKHNSVLSVREIEYV